MQFDRLTNQITKALGSKWAILTAVCFVFSWASLGPYYKYSDHWQMIINTSTTIITFLMTFIILNSTNRDSIALHAKVDEMIRVKESANDEFIGLEEKTEKEIMEIKNRLKDVEEDVDVQCD